MAEATARLSRRTVVGYGVGSLGTGGFGTVPGLLLAFYLTDSLGVAAGVAGLALLLPKAWDVVVDPFVGRLTDRTAGRRGTRRPWLLVGALTVPVGFALTFAAPPGLDGGAAAAWVVVLFLLTATGFSLFQVPYVAMPTEMTEDPAERTTVTAWRIGFLAVGILLFGAVAPAIVDAGGGGRAGYVGMGVVVGLGIGAAMLGAWWGTAEVRTTRLGDVGGSLGSELRAALGHRPFATLLGCFVLQACATGALLGTAPYFARWVLGDAALTTVLFASLVGPALLVMPLWHRVAGRVGKRRGYLAATALFVLGTAGLALGRDVPHGVSYGLVALVGVAYAGLQLFPLAMLPDVLAADAASSGSSRAGVFTGVWTASETSGLALGPFLVVSGLLAATGYVSSSGTVAVQSDSVITGIVLAFSLLPALLALLSLPLLLAHRPPATTGDPS